MVPQAISGIAQNLGARSAREIGNSGNNLRNGNYFPRESVQCYKAV